MSNASLIISVYDKTRELELIFKSLEKQTYDKFEIIIAEDGENAGISAVVEKYKERFPNRLKHLTQKDSGFRKNKILNTSIKNSETDHLIFIDGDCIPHKNFINAHFQSRRAETVLCGRRVAMGKSISEQVNNDNIDELISGKWNFRILKDSLAKDDVHSKNAEEAFIIKNELARKAFIDKDEHILGCNFSAEKIMLEKINGFDENYIGPGLGEDSDIEFRLRMTGSKFRSVRNLAVQYHMWHGKTKEAETNFKYFEQVKKEKQVFCSNGLIKTATG